MIVTDSKQLESKARTRRVKVDPEKVREVEDLISTLARSADKLDRLELHGAGHHVRLAIKYVRTLIILPAMAGESEAE
jgi:hypothetical protein